LRESFLLQWYGGTIPAIPENSPLVRIHLALRIIKSKFLILNIYGVLLSRLTPYAEEIAGDHQRGFRRNRPTIDHIFCIHQILEEKNGNTMRQCISCL
jgi:hypothetical protein